MPSRRHNSFVCKDHRYCPHYR